MKIHSVRLGLATNSSSSHSIVFLSPTARAGVVDAAVAAGEFGWEHFTARSVEAKKMYLALILRDALLPHTSADAARVVAEGWLGRALPPDAYIDHQSVLTLPNLWCEKGVNMAFFADLAATVLRDDVAILGGNDNDGDVHPLVKAHAAGVTVSPIGTLPRDDDPDDRVARKDPVANAWTLFNRKSGAKIRLSLDPAAPPYTKAYAPELADVKITDYCPMGCAFCYQDSTTAGRHASVEVLDAIALALGRLKCFEVALGGGETTLHPQFPAVLRAFRDRGVVPNFTTKSLAWLRDAARRAEILEAAGAFAYSVDDAAGAAALGALLAEHELNADRDAMAHGVQVVMGTVTRAEFGKILGVASEHRMRVTLLGYKTDGRGAAVTPIPYEWWLGDLQKWVKQHYDVQVGIDTALAAAYDTQLRAAKVAPLLYATHEGKFSMYLDAVAMTAAPASYGTLRRDQLVARDDLHEQIKTAFAAY